MKSTAEALNLKLRQEAPKPKGMNKNVFIGIGLVLVFLIVIGSRLQDHFMGDDVANNNESEVTNERDLAGVGKANSEITASYSFDEVSYEDILRQQALEQNRIREQAANNAVTNFLSDTGDGTSENDEFSEDGSSDTGWNIDLTGRDRNSSNFNADEEAIKLGLRQSSAVNVKFSGTSNLLDGVTGGGINSSQLEALQKLAPDVDALLQQQLAGLEGLQPQDAVIAQNQQEEKASFINNSGGFVNPHVVRNPISPYMVMQGTAIPVTLVRGVNTDLPGEIGAMVTRDIYDNVTGKYLLIPKFSTFHGVYQSTLSYGQERILSVWNRLIFPNGSSIELDKFTSADLNGFAGFEGEVDTHILSTMTGALLSSVISVGAVAAQQGTESNDVNDLLTGGVAQSSEQIGQEFIQKRMNRQNTLTALIGKRFSVTVSKDLVLRKYNAN